MLLCCSSGICFASLSASLSPQYLLSHVFYMASSVCDFTMMLLQGKLLCFIYNTYDSDDTDTHSAFLSAGVEVCLKHHINVLICLISILCPSNISKETHVFPSSIKTLWYSYIIKYHHVTFFNKSRIFQKGPLYV